MRFITVIKNNDDTINTHTFSDNNPHPPDGAIHCHTHCHATEAGEVEIRQDEVRGGVNKLNIIKMSKRCELQKEYYQQHGNYKGTGNYSDVYVGWLEERILELLRQINNNNERSNSQV